MAHRLVGFWGRALRGSFHYIATKIGPSSGNGLLLESSGFLLLQDGSYLLLE